MENNEMKKCPFCAELIQPEAIKCRFCGSNLSEKKSSQGSSFQSDDWHRVSNGKRVAGVCTGLANQFDAPQLILPLRLFFILTTIFYGFGLILYIALWILMPSDHNRIEHVYVEHSAQDIKDTSGSAAVKQGNKTGVMDFAISLFLIIVGALFLFGFFFNSHIFPFSMFGNHISLPSIHFPHVMGPFSWIPFGILTTITVFGLFIIFIGGLKIIRFFVGCGLILFGTIFLLLFVPFLPLMFPGLLILGLLLLILGGLKLLF